MGCDEVQSFRSGEERKEVIEAIRAGAHQIVVLPVSEQDLEVKVEAAREMAG